MKVCILTETYNPVIGGGERQAQALAEGLARRGCEISVLTRRSHASLKKSEQSGPISLYRLPPVGAGHLNKWGLLLTTLPALVRLRLRCDVVFVSGFRIMGAPAVLAAGLLGKVCVLKADSRGEMSGAFFAAGLARLGLAPSWLPFRWFLALRNYLLRRADCFVAISTDLAAEFSAHGVEPGKIQAIPNSVDTCKFRPVSVREKCELRRRLGLPEQDAIVIYTGRLVSYKGLPLLLRVWREVAAARRNARLLLVGAGGLDIHNCEDELRAYVTAHRLEQSVRFTGAVDNVHEYLQASDLFVFPSESEAFGISLIEAMACGLPVISTHAGGLKDIVEHGRNGLVAPAGDFSQIHGALERLLDDHELAASLGRAARRTAQERFSAGSILERYADLFERLLGPVAARPLVEG